MISFKNGLLLMSVSKNKVFTTNLNLNLTNSVPKQFQICPDLFQVGAIPPAPQGWWLVEPAIF